MSMIYAERPSDSPYVETITHGRTAERGTTIRPAECNWHMVLVKHEGQAHSIIVGPWTTAGVVTWDGEAEILWIKFKLGVFMPHLPVRDFVNSETVLQGGVEKSFWLHGSVWQFPDHENVDTFINRLAHDEILVLDPVVPAAFQDQLPDEMSPRTLRYRFLQSTGLSRSYIRQMKRAQQAVRLLQQGVSILDTVFEAGYFDQPHLTRSLKQFIGSTPAQITRLNQL